jgi:hypothetical protein
VPVQYTEALSAVTKSLAHLASKKREGEEENYMIDFDKLGTRPMRASPPTLFPFPLSTAAHGLLMQLMCPTCLVS